MKDRQNLPRRWRRVAARYQSEVVDRRRWRTWALVILAQSLVEFLMAFSGRTTIGRYQVVRVLGEGGMGAVYLARDPTIDRMVAIKLMLKGFEGGEAHERFFREARAIGRLRHPNIITVFDVGEHDGEPYIAMEFLDGQTLSDLIRTGKPETLAGRVELIEELCAGLAYAHRTGITHRDIKPANVIVEPAVGLKILDFGIAREETSSLTLAGTVMGSLNYMAPEQFAGLRIDHRVDVFAVGAVAYELISGTQAFPGSIHSGLLRRILDGEPDPLSVLCPWVDTGISDVITRCLRKDPEERYNDLDQVRFELRNLRQGLGGRGTVPNPTGIGHEPARRTPGSDTRARLQQLREDRIEQLLTTARAALQKRDYAAARDACQQAQIMDPEGAKPQDVIELILRQEQTEHLLGQAREELDRGALTAATELLGRAAAARPTHPELADLRGAIDQARLEIAEQERHRQLIDAAIGRARDALTASRFDEAQAHLDAVQGLDPANEIAAELGSRLTARREAQRRADDDALAAVVVEEANRLFASGAHDRARKLLRQHRPPHPVVAAALVSLAAELDAINRREEERRTTAEQGSPAAPTQHLTDRTAVHQISSTGPAVEQTKVFDRRDQPGSRAPAAPAPVSRTRWLVGGGVAATAVVVSAVLFWPSGPDDGGALGSATAHADVMFDIRPWAAIESLTRTDGLTVEAHCPATPCFVSVPAGEYNVRASNPHFPAPLEFSVTATAGVLREVRETLPALQPEAEARRILEGR